MTVASGNGSTDAGVRSGEKAYAGAAIRAAAVIVDGLLIFIVLGALVGLITGSNYYENDSGDYSAGFNLVTGPSLLLLALGLVYFVGLEFWRGATLGKLLFGLRVQSDAGGRITLGQALLRNLLRVIDSIPYAIPYLLGAIFIWTSKEKKRIGDRSARTVVVSVR